IVSGANLYAAAGTYSIAVQIDDGGGSTAGAASSATVTDAPLTAAGTTITAVEGSPFSGKVATFTDANPFAVAGDFTARITWGGGQSSGGTVPYDSTRGIFVVSGANTYVDAGSYPITVQIADAGGSSANPSSTASVSDAPLSALGTTITAQEGSPFTGLVAT